MGSTRLHSTYVCIVDASADMAYGYTHERKIGGRLTTIVGELNG